MGSPVHQFQKFFWPNDFLLSVMKDLLHTFPQNVSQALSRAVHVLLQEDKLNYFEFPSLCSWDDFRSLECRIGEGPFFYVSILSLDSVSYTESEKM